MKNGRKLGLRNWRRRAKKTCGRFRTHGLEQNERSEKQWKIRTCRTRSGRPSLRARRAVPQQNQAASTDGDVSDARQTSKCCGRGIGKGRNGNQCGQQNGTDAGRDLATLTWDKSTRRGNTRTLARHRRQDATSSVTKMHAGGRKARTDALGRKRR